MSLIRDEFKSFSDFVAVSHKKITLENSSNLSLTVTSKMLSESISLIDVELLESLKDIGRDFIKSLTKTDITESVSDGNFKKKIQTTHKSYNASVASKVFENAKAGVKQEILTKIVETKFGESKTKIMIQKLVNMGLFENSKSKNLMLVSLIAAFSGVSK